MIGQDEASARQVRCSINFESFLKISTGDDSRWNQELFDNLWVKEIRNACIANWMGGPAYLDDQKWFESRILRFRELSEDLWKNLLKVYIFRSDPSLTPRALEFAIQILKNDERDLPIISKYVSADANLYHYWRVPSMDEFIRISLKQIEPGDPMHKSQYWESQWRMAENAMTMIVQARDITWLEYIKKLARLHREGQISRSKTSMPDPPWKAAATERAFLSKAMEMLQNAAKEQTTETFGTFLAKEAQLTFPPKVLILYEHRDGKIIVSVNIKPHPHSEYADLKKVLDSCRVIWNDDGFLPLVISLNTGAPFGSTEGVSFSEDGGDFKTAFSATPTAGKNRVRLRFEHWKPNGEVCKVGSATLYIYV